VNQVSSAEIAEFEGLVGATARQIVEGGCEVEFDDIRQLLRVSVWNALGEFETARLGPRFKVDRLGRTPRQRFVYMCLWRTRYDIEKRRPKRYDSSIEVLRAPGARNFSTTADHFDARYLSVDAELFEGDELELPNTLTPVERRVVEMLVEGFSPREIEHALDLSAEHRRQATRSARERLADWRPDVSERRRGPTPPLPRTADVLDPAPSALVA
jgi:DNA-directed RNA polymerase specialized sigma24 family protein